MHRGTSKIALRAAGIIILTAAAGSAQTVMQDSTTKAYIIAWDRNSETDMEYYNIWLIQPETLADTSADSTKWIYTRIGTTMQPPPQDSVTFEIHQVNNSIVAFAFTVTAVDHVGNQSGYAKNRDNPSLRRTRWILGLPPGAPKGLRLITVKMPDSVMMMIFQGKMIDMEVLQNTIIKTKE